jgi:predicted NBD/HSP70 family sugar kinase
MTTAPVIVGIDNGGTKNNVTVLDAAGEFLIDHLIELPSRVGEGPGPAIDAMEAVFLLGLERSGVTRAQVRAVGLDTPGPASAEGVISSRGATNFAIPEWWGFDVRGALEARLGLPVVYSNDANAAAMYAHHAHFGMAAAHRSSVAAIVGTGLGGGVVEHGEVVSGAAGMAGELGHVHIPMHGLLEADQPIPQCNCGFEGDAESFASLTGITKNLLPYWLTRYPNHELAATPIKDGAKALRPGRTGDDGPPCVRAAGDAPRPAVHDRRNFTDPTPTSSVAEWWRPRPSSASGSSTSCAPTPICAKSRRRSPSSRSSPTSTWPAPVARPSPPATTTLCCPNRNYAVLPAPTCGLRRR